ncbi:IS5 family transposase [Curvibacter lanceolatus]|uniref:IS5 family transposase n=1 Tax=Curvibacter lanceolatus TaxID=86182 RepID=UPI000377CEC7|nr:IS5 family transposase [Curvibacter lanceolatus]
MKQQSLGLGHSNKRTRRRELLGEMEHVVPWAELVALVAPYMPEGRRGRPPFAVEPMLRVHFVQQWFNLSDPAMEDAPHDVPLFREFAGLGGWDNRVPDESTILRFRHLLEQHKLAPQILQVVNQSLTAKGLLLKSGTVVGATVNAAPSFTKNASGERDPEMKQNKKGNQWYFGMKAHISADADSGLVHTVRVIDVVLANSPLHGHETKALGGAGYRGAHKSLDARDGVNWSAAMRPGQHHALDMNAPRQRLIDEIDRVKARIRAKVEHPFRVVKRLFGHVKVRYRGLAKNTAQLHTLFALANLWMAKRKLMGVAA